MDKIKEIARVGMKIIFRVEEINKDNIPKEGGAILCSNHISSFDGPLIVTFSDRKINIVAKQELWGNKVISYFLDRYNAIKIDRNKPLLSSLKEMRKVLCNDELLALFPEGTRNGIEKGLEVKGGAAFLGAVTKKPIVPIKIVGKYRLFSKIKLIYGSPFMVYDKKEGITQIMRAIDDIEEPPTKIYKKC